MRRKLLLWVVVLSLMSGSLTAYAQGDGESGGFTLDVDGMERSFYVHVPTQYDGSRPFALALMLHGSGMNGVIMMVTAGFDAQADLHDAIVVYPDGIGGNWMADDVTFLTALLDHLLGIYNIDPQRVYLSGYSSGGMLALRLRCELPDRFSKTAAIGASLSFEIAVHCADSEPASTLIALGTSDSAFPWLGYAIPDGEGGVDGTLSVNQLMTFLPALNECGHDMVSADITAPDGPVRVQRDAYVDCAQGTNVTLISLINMRHDWPVGMRVTLADGSSGDLAAALWEWFIAP